MCGYNKIGHGIIENSILLQKLKTLRGIDPQTRLSTLLHMVTKSPNYVLMTSSDVTKSKERTKKLDKMKQPVGQMVIILLSRRQRKMRNISTKLMMNLSGKIKLVHRQNLVYSKPWYESMCVYVSKEIKKRDR